MVEVRCEGSLPLVRSLGGRDNTAAESIAATAAEPAVNFMSGVEGAGSADGPKSKSGPIASFTPAIVIRGAVIISTPARQACHSPGGTAGYFDPIALDQRS